LVRERRQKEILTMRQLKRIMTASCAAFLLLGVAGAFNSAGGLLGTQKLLAGDDRDQDSYHRGYKQGREDARDNRRPASGRRWDADFRRGYEDGYNQASRGSRRSRDDERWGREGGYNDRGSDRYERSRNRNDDGYYSGPGRMSWRGRVDDYVELRIQGGRVRSVERGGAPTYNERASFSSPLPRSDVRVDVKKRDGRGRVSLLEQPSRNNNYTAVIRIDDSKGGADDYEIEMEWR
jgi:hypothetical protein